MRVRSTPLVGALMVLVVLVGACGNRAPDTLKSQARAGAINGSDGNGSGTGNGTGAGTGSGAGTGTAAGTGTGAGTGMGTGNGTGTGTGTATGTRSGGGTSKCSSSGDKGQSGNTMTVGLVADTTGPVSGVFQGAVQGAQAYAAYVNSTFGGICGMQVVVKAADSKTNCQGNQAATQDLVGKVFAFVGSFSVYDNCGAKILKNYPDVADVHRALDPAAQIPTNFSIEAGRLGYASGMFEYYAKKFPGQIKAVGTLSTDVPAAAASQRAFVNVAKKSGWNFVYQRGVAATETDFTSDFVKMCKQKGVKVFYTSATTASNAAAMVNNEKAAGCPDSLINIISIAYDQAFIKAMGSNVRAADGMLGWNEFALFFNQEEARNSAEVALFQQWMARVYPGRTLDLFALFSWESMRLFQDGMEKTAPQAKRQDLVAALRTITKFNGRGSLAPINPSSRTVGPTCYVLWELQNGVYRRVDTPAKGYRCDGHYEYAS
ncbi:MAG: hypothetical protein QOG53_1282 [Frankiales bacterium]|jgi:ABC-type branched-subunit amino acid transport system substrate-binding protein|nr:hypothetical protein [Frankiales bacterium]